MGFLIGIAGLVVGAVGFWLDFSADPFLASRHLSTISYFGIGIFGILVAILGFVLQLWLPRLKIVGPNRVGAPTRM
ncbi:MAG: hypothetical protein JWM91_1824 [Rhodospirillales bacterium]|nr:hypothetical protein [Rhodospirillales bacterium]